MPRLIHLFPESAARSIRRAGIRGAAKRLLTEKGTVDIEHGVYAMPVMPSFWDTHQWTRELRPPNGEKMAAVHFRMASDEPVWVGRYNLPHERCPLGEAIARIRSAPEGNEIVLERSIPVSVILDIRSITQRVGWLRAPGGALDCVCDYCLPQATPNLKKRLRAERKRWLEAARAASDEQTLLGALERAHTPFERLPHEALPRFLVAMSLHPSEEVRLRIARLFAFGPLRRIEAELLALLADASQRVRRTALDAMVRRLGIERAIPYVVEAGADLKRHLAREAVYILPSASRAMTVALDAIAATGDDVLVEAVEATRRELSD